MTVGTENRRAIFLQRVIFPCERKVAVGIPLAGVSKFSTNARDEPESVVERKIGCSIDYHPADRRGIAIGPSSLRWIAFLSRYASLAFREFESDRPRATVFTWKCFPKLPSAAGEKKGTFAWKNSGEYLCFLFLSR